MNYAVLYNLVREGHINRPGTKIEQVRALVIHWTANLSRTANAMNNAKYFNRNYVFNNNRWEEVGIGKPFTFASAHYIVDEESIVCAIPEDEVAHHANSKTSYSPYARQYLANNAGVCKPNDYTIGIEMCVNQGNDWDKTIEITSELASDIMMRHNLSMNQLIRHYDVTFKTCPKPFVDNPIAWSDFKALVARKIKIKEDALVYKDITGKHMWAIEALEWAKAEDFIGGDGKGNFFPDRPITRLETVVLFHRFYTIIKKLIKG